ncbi:MAG: hypothetical protein NC318_13315 [Blautia sp.]|nr:hypothetical protein [Blautia sp.]
MKVKKMLVIAAMVLTASTGCGGQDSEQMRNYEIPVEESNDEIEQDRNSSEVSKKETVSGLQDAMTDSDEETKDTAVKELQRSDSKEYLGGKVRSIGQESFVISRTLVDADGYVTMPEAGSADEQLVTIRCTEQTVFEHWTIQGGGAGIVTREASFSEITEDGGLEAEGYFEGEEFIATKVIIEVYQ